MLYIVKLKPSSRITEIVADYVIPAGWKVLPVLSAGHLDPTLFENPLEFDPFRWNVGSCINHAK